MSDFHSLDPGPLGDGDLSLELAEQYSGDPDANLVPAYRFRMRAGGVEAGIIELRVGHTSDFVLYAGHLAYTVSPAHRGHRYAVRACRLLLPLALAHGVNPVWVTCNPDNYASRQTCELVGARLVEVVDLPEGSDMYLRGARQKCRYRIDFLLDSAAE